MSAEDQDYTRLTIKQLVCICREKSIRGYSGKTKDEVIRLLGGKAPPHEAPDGHPKAEGEACVYTARTYVEQPMLTCIGNKRKIVHYIRNVVDQIAAREGKTKLTIVDGFAGSCVVSRELAAVSSEIYVNDMELYSFLMAKCFLQTPTFEQQSRIERHIDKMNDIAARPEMHAEGIISRLYAPKVTVSIKEGERCFYTRENALIIDTLRQYIADVVEPDVSPYCLVPLLCKASVHTNTCGIFKGFFKKDGIGHFGGRGENSLSRIMGAIRLEVPIWNTNRPPVAFCFNKDVNELVQELPDNIDVIYLDPPYNCHAYGSNYFLLNVIAENREPVAISAVSGIPTGWNRSNYNYRETAISSMGQLIRCSLQKSKYVLISYNNEGLIKKSDWMVLFNGLQYCVFEIPYDAFKGSRNLADRSMKVIELMFLIWRG
jgi:adenine-specific DNA-methyltransferase